MNEVFSGFSFEHRPSLVLGLAPVLVNIFIFIYVLASVRKSPLSTTFLIFLTTLILWRLQEVSLQLSTTQQAAGMWYHFFSIVTNFIGATGLHFVLELTGQGKWRQKNLHLAALYLPSLLFSMFFASGIEYMRFERTQSWGWVSVPSHPMSIAAYMLIGLHALMMMVLLSIHTWRLRKTNSTRFKRVRIVLIGSAAPILAGCSYQILLPIFFGYTPVPVASSVAIVFSLAILLAITKYNLLEYSPMHQWDNIVENMNEGILIVDNNDTVQYVNSKFCQMLGYSPSELLHTPAPRMLAPGQDKTLSNKMDERRKKLFLDKYEVVMKKKDGSHIICEVNAQPYLDPAQKVIGSIAIHCDVTEQRKAAKKIKESESRYRSFIEQASDGIFITDPGGLISEVNTKACQMLGYSRQQLLGMSMGRQLLQPEPLKNPASHQGEQQQEKTGKAEKVQKEKTERSSLSVRSLRRSDGSQLEVEISSRLMPDGKTLDIVRDITERKRAERELMDKIHEMDSFIHRTSHDLRGPLASITGLTQMGKQHLNSKEADLYFDKIHYSTVRLDGILQQLSKFARVAEVKPEPVEIDLAREVDDIVESLRHLPGFGLLEIQKQIDPLRLRCDKTLLIIVLQNLVANAVNYHDKGREKPWICIEASEKDGGATELVVSDNGPGIEETIQHKVFDMFYRASTSSQGSGLGLYIVKNAVRKLNGSIKLISGKGLGSSFIVVIPNAEKEE